MSHTRPADKKDIIAILGAGPMGLAAAYQLAQKGYAPLIFEADDRLGGMSASFDFSGLRVERFYHFHCRCDHALLKILHELDLTRKLHWVDTKMGYWLEGKMQPWGNPIALFKFKGLSFISKLRYALYIFLSSKRKNWRALDQLYATEWIKRWVGKEAYDILWHNLFEYKFYHYASNVSAAWIWSRIQRMALSRKSIMQEQLGYVEGGSETLLQAMASYIETKGGKIYLQSRVEEVLIKNGYVHALRIGGEKICVNKVVSTIPVPFVPAMIPAIPQAILDSWQKLKNIAIVCVLAKLRKQVSQNFWLNIKDKRMNIPGFVEYTNLYPLKDHLVYVPFYLPGDHPLFFQPNAYFAQKVKFYLAYINPDLCEEDFIDMHVHRYRYAQPICEPGHLAKLPPISLPIKGLWVADTSYYYPEDRSISESVNLGRKIADSVMRSFFQVPVRGPS